MKYFLLITFALLLTSCSNQLIFERKKYISSFGKNNSSPSNYNSAQIKMEVLEAKNDENINKIIFENIKEMSSFIDHQNLSIENYNQITKKFVDEYKKVSNKNNNSKIQNWDFTIESVIEYETEEFVNIALIYTSSYGKTNEIGGKRSLIFSKQTGNQLKLNDIFLNKNIISKLVETKFRNKYNISSSINLNSQGFCFENGTFYLTNNVFFNIEGVKFIYNTNEIANFEKGSFEIFLPYQEIDTYLIIK